MTLHNPQLISAFQKLESTIFNSPLHESSPAKSKIITALVDMIDYNVPTNIHVNDCYTKSPEAYDMCIHDIGHLMNENELIASPWFENSHELERVFKTERAKVHPDKFSSSSQEDKDKASDQFVELTRIFDLLQIGLTQWTLRKLSREYFKKELIDNVKAVNKKRKTSSYSRSSYTTKKRSLSLKTTRTKSPTSTESSKGATTTTQSKAATVSKPPIDPSNNTGHNPSLYQYTSLLEQREGKNKYSALYISVVNLQECLKVDKSIKDQIILILSVRYIFDKNTLTSMN